MENVILQLNDLVKTYPGVRALDGVSLTFRKGEVHALVGENGAGKSTLIKCVAGAIAPDSGEILINGKSYSRLTPAQAREAGIEVIYQEFNLVPSLTAAENICLGEKHGRLPSQRKMRKLAEGILSEFNVKLDWNALVRTMSSSQQQLIEIAKAVSKNAKVIVMDEPTGAITTSETEALFRVVERLRTKGVTVIYITHRMEEIFRIADRVSVLRDGKYIATRDVAETSRSELIKLMVGRELSESYPARPPISDEVVFRASNLATNEVSGVSFDLRKGEILGISGLVGAGRTELARAIFGVDRLTQGGIELMGQAVKISSPGMAIKKGIGLIPEDRKRQGVFLMMDIRWNISFASIKRFCRHFVVNRKQEQRVAEEYKQRLSIRTPSLYQKVSNLSGGNQQKVVLAKTLATDCDVIIFDEPTRGIDVGAKREIYLLMNELTQAGKSIIMISSDMEELFGMSDRIIVMCERHMVGELTRDEFNQERVLSMASGN